jgi:hypothetical protein
MDVADRDCLHKDVADMMRSRISMQTLRRRAEDRGASGKSYDARIVALNSDTARRLRLALKDHLAGIDAIAAAEAHKVEASEIRFLAAHLKR